MKKIVLLSIASLLFFAACQDVIDFEVGQGSPKFVVEASLSNVYGAKVRLSQDSHVDEEGYPVGMELDYARIYKGKAPYIDSATLVAATDSLGTYYQFADDEDMVIAPDMKYAVKLKYGNTVFVSEDSMATPVPLDSLLVEPSLRGDGRFLGLFLYVKEPQGYGDNYLWSFYVKKKLNDSTYADGFRHHSEASSIIVANDEMVDGKHLKGFEIFTDFHDAADTTEAVLWEGDSVFVVQSVITKPAYEYWSQAMYQASSTGFMFDPPPANIVGNITMATDPSKTVLGFFAVNADAVSNTAICPKVLRRD